MSDSEPILCDINDWALSKEEDFEYVSESDSCTCASIVYDEIVVHSLNPPAADDSIFFNDTILDENIHDKSFTSDHPSNASCLSDNSDNDPDFNIEDYDSVNSDDSDVDVHVHSTQDTHRILTGNNHKVHTDREISCDVYDFASNSQDEENNGEKNTDDNQDSNVHSLEKDKDLCFSHASQKSVDSVIPETNNNDSVDSAIPETSNNDSIDGEIPGTSNNVTTESVNKKHVCVFCEKPYAKIVRHYEQKHCDEVVVAKALAFPKKSQERHAIWTELRHKGNFASNKPVLVNKVGTFIPARKPKNDLDANDYIPCPHCLGSYKKSTLWRHAKRCVLKPEHGETSSKKANAVGKYLVPIPAECGNSFKLDILTTMKQDGIYYLIVKDPLIIKFGEHLYAKHRDEKYKHAYVKQKMREVGRFLQTYNQSGGAASLSDTIHSTKFKDCVKAVRELCRFDDDKGSCGIPSLALKLGQALTTCACIKQAEAIEAQDKDTKEAMDEFLTLYKLKWNTSVSTCANRTLHANSFNNPKRIPLTRDIQKMNKYLEKCAQEAETDLESATEDKELVLRKLRELTLAQIVLFNRRRGGEAQRIEVQQVRKGFLAKNLNEDVMNTLSKFEQKLATTLERFEIRGKRGRRVPVLLTERHKRRVLVLLEHDTGESKYLFPRGEDTTLSTWKILSDVAKECGAEKPELLTSTNLRKHVSTVSQILNLQEHELDSIADFLGHDIRVHRQYYRLSEDTIQLAKVSKLLCEMESGNIVKHKNKTLEEIQCTEEEEVAMDEESDIDVLGQEGATERDAPMEEESSKQQAVSDVEEAIEEKDAEPLPEKNDEPLPKKKRQKKKKVMNKRQVWTGEETDAVFEGLAQMIRLRQLPGKKDCQTLLKKYPCLHRRDWKHIKYYVKNYLDKDSKSEGKSNTGTKTK